MANERITCVRCNKEKVSSGFYNHRSKFLDDKYGLCKGCVKDLTNEDAIGTIYDVLEFLNIPFVLEIWEGARTSKKHTFGDYMRQINSLPQYKDLEWKDGDFSRFGVSREDMEDTNEVGLEDDELDELKLKWGKYKTSELYELERFWREMNESFEIETASHKDYLHKICKISLKMNIALDNGDVGEFEKYSRVYDNLMKSAKFTAVQRSAVDSTGGLATFGEMVEMIEKHGFIKPSPIEEDMDIVEATIADMKNYTKTLVLGDSSISSLVQETLDKIQQKADEEDELEEELGEQDGGI